ncbi:MAG: helix-turn-helix domain-containing protein [Bacilli bacterium]|nr:helix-turn-helix domain-containing protein [Bacilli bacterium]
MHVRALKVEFLEDVTLQMTFQDGKVVGYDMSRMFGKYPQLEELRRNRKLFESGHLDLTGFAVIWNDELDFDATSIYDDGEVVGCVETTLNQQIGFLLAKTRDEMNITQTELSKKSHIDQGDISKIERGIGNPTIAKISKLFRALGRSISLTLL